jgi:hypothetical protein
MHAFLRFLALSCCVAAGSASGDGGASQCGAQAEGTPLDTESATASVLANVSNSDGSIRSASSRMLTKAIDTAKSSQPPQRVVFSSIPNLSKKKTSDDEMCRQQETATKENPIRFDGKHFASTEDLNDWIMDFTQGKGDDGKSLYAQCPGKCSPQYTWLIDPVESGLAVDARVVCGMPRDRSGNKYQLSTALTAICPEPN